MYKEEYIYEDLAQRTYTQAIDIYKKTKFDVSCLSNCECQTVKSNTIKSKQK